MNKTWKHLIGFALPLALAAGCAHDRSMVASSPEETTALTSTSDNTAERVYSADSSSPIGQYAPPPGASPNDWTLAEEIRSLLTSDKKLVREPMGAVVDKGVVTLHGYVHNSRAGERIEQAVAGLPGVTHVDNQLIVQNILGDIKGKSKDY